LKLCANLNLLALCTALLKKSFLPQRTPENAEILNLSLRTLAFSAVDGFSDKLKEEIAVAVGSALG